MAAPARCTPLDRCARALLAGGALAAALLALASSPLAAQTGATPFLHADGFEGGATASWSSVQPMAWPLETCARPFTDVDSSGATVVGSGTPASCTEAALNAALASNNGMIRFSCGAAPHTIVVTSEKQLVPTANLVLDGGGTVALSGGGTTRILGWRPPFGTNPRPVLTVQNLTFVDGYTGNLPGNTTASGGAAIFRGSGADLRVIDSVFTRNVCPIEGQDVAGGAIYSVLTGSTTVVGSLFFKNRCSSGGGLGNLHNHLTVVNSRITQNSATGHGGNPGLGGNGGGIYLDGNDQTVSLCGVTLSENDAGARGAGLFRVSNNGVGPMTIDRTTVAGNSSPPGPDSQAGGLYLQGLQLTITNSTISRNVASSVGGMFVATNPGTQTLSMTNVTVAENHGRTGLGSGMTVASGITGALSHLTVARNSTEGATSFASAIAFGSGLSLTNSVIADNLKVFTWEDVSCNVTHSGAGGFQWPQRNAGNELETPCASVTFLDPALGRLRNEGGPTSTILPSAAAVRRSVSVGCPATDQRGRPRPVPCTPGAVEME